MKRRPFFPLALLGLTLVLAGAFADTEAAVRRVVGEPARRTAPVAAPAWRQPAYPSAAVARLPFREIAVQRINELQNENSQRGLKPTQIGISRLTASDGVQRLLPALRWQAMKGGAAVARIEVTSPDALALRVGLQVDALDSRVEFRFAGSDAPERVLAMANGEEIKRLMSGDRLYWTPVTDGASQIIEIYAPAGVDARGIRLQLPQVSHLVTNSKSDFSFVKSIGSSGSCNVDVACRVAELGQNFVNAKNAVARMVFTVTGPGGGTFTCTGTLLADTDTATQLAYFYSANHCISNQTVASTLNTYWGFEATSCGSGLAAANVLLTGGAAYLYSDSTTDASLLRLNGTPPAGAFYVGWDSTALPASSAIRGIHHPSADLKKVSQGQQMSTSSSRIEVAWTSGTTEGGSSGSGLFTYDSNGYYLRGGLYGGSAACSNSGSISDPDNRDYFSRFDVVYPSIQQYLAPAGTVNGPTRDNSGVWYAPAESGWGVTAYQYNNTDKVLFVIWYVYDASGKASWYQLDGSWTGTDVSSGPVRKYTGPAWSTSFNPASVSFAVVGSATLTFTSSNTATLNYTVDGVTRTISLSKIGG